MANVKDLLVNGSARVIGTIYGNATSANNSDKLDGKHLSEIAAAKSTTLAWGASSTIATIGGNNITITMPANPNTDTHYTTGITAGATGTTSNSATTNGNTFIKIKDNSTHRGQIKIIGSGATSVSSDANGVITINSTDNNTTYGSMSVDEGTTGTATTNRVLTAANLKGIINAHAPTLTGIGASGSWGIDVTGNAATATNADKLDGYHENSFLRHRDTVGGSGGTSHSDSLWSQIGIRQYNNALPDAMADNATYTYGAVISLPGATSRLDIWYNHQTSTNGDGLRYRTGWNDDKRAWATILDSLNYGTIADERYVKKTGDTMTGNLTAPSIYTSNWFRSTGSTGWYNETHGGGWYMSDSTYIRNYAGKTTRLDNLCLGTDNNSYRLYVNGNTLLHMDNASGASTELSPTLRVDGKLNIYDNITSGGTANSLLNILSNGTHEYGIVMKLHSYGGDSPAIRFSHSSDINDLNKQVNTNWSIGMYYNTTDKFAITQDRGTNSWGAARLIMDPGGVTNFYITNRWLNDSVLQIGRKDENTLTDRAVIGVTDGNLHLDPYGNHDTYLNYYNHGRTYFSGSTYYINEDGSYYNGTAANAINADTVDECHASQLLYGWDTWVDLSSLNNDIYYPVTGTNLPHGGYHKIKVTVQLDSGTKPTWSTHTQGFTTNVEIYATASGWGTTGAETIVMANYCAYTNCGQPVGYIQNDYSSTPVLWLRGGGKYHVYTDYNCIWTVRTSTYYTFGDANSTYKQSVTPTTTNPGLRGINGIIWAGQVYGAVWNDYAEYRQSDTTQPGRCIIENGDDTLSLSTSRLQKGAEIVSDTFGFAIGETDECKTPIACSGRVLAYPYEDREEFKRHIGDCVCSGPDGTVSIMTPEEEKEYPSCIIGTISAVPSYEKWGSGEVDVSGRVWIRIR